MTSIKKQKLDKEASGSGRLYHADWFSKFGVIEKDGKAFCIVCKEGIVLRSFNVKRHFDTNHKKLLLLSKEEKSEHFTQKLKEYQLQTNIFKSMFIPKNNITAASFDVSYSIATHGKPLSDGEFLKEAFLSCAENLFHDFNNKDKIIKRFEDLPISRNTVKNRISVLSNDVSNQLIADLNDAKMFSISLDESTDVTGLARLAVYIRYPAKNIMMEELLTLLTLKEKTTGLDIFDEVKKEITKKRIDLKKIVSVTTDGAPSMIGKHNGFVKHLKDEIEHPLLEFHCLIHQEALCAKKGLKPLEDVLCVVTKIVNFITARALNKREFAVLLDEVESQYSGLLMYNNVRWPSRGQVLKRFICLLDEIRLFLIEKKQHFPELTNLNWLSNLMFFCDLTEHFNALNKKLQGRGQIVLTMFGHIKAFISKLDIFANDLVSEKLKYFPSLKEQFTVSSFYADNIENKTVTLNKYCTIIKETKELFCERFSQFQTIDSTLPFLIYPHNIKFEDIQVSFFNWLNIDNLEMELVEFQNSVIWRNKFVDLNCKLEESYEYTDKSLSSPEERTENLILTVWNLIPSSFTSMKILATALLTMFGSTYNCEQLFSAMNFIKSTTRNRLGNDISAACVALKVTKYSPRITALASEQQQQISH